MAPDIKSLEGKKYTMHPDRDSGCQQCMFCCFSCGSMLVTAENKVSEDGTTLLSTNYKICDIFPMSPIPCCLLCGVGPCAAQFKFVRDPADPTKWNGTGQVVAGECCHACFNHEGDVFIFDDEHDGSSKEKAIMLIGGNNPTTPPCFIGKKIGEFYAKKTAGGGPPSEETMERA